MAKNSGKCPNCGSDQIGGLMAAFFVPIDQEGEMIGQWREYQSETAIGTVRLCYGCEHEWDGDAEEEEGDDPEKRRC